MFNAELRCTLYNIFKNDRKDRRIGVLIAVKKQIVCEQISINSINRITKLFLKLSLSNNISLIVICRVYFIPPSATIHSYSKHCDLIES